MFGRQPLSYANVVASLALFVALGAVSAVGQTIYSVFWQTIQTNF